MDFWMVYSGVKEWEKKGLDIQDLLCIGRYIFTIYSNPHLNP